MKEICSVAIEQSHKTGFRFRSSITTNGYLLNNDNFKTLLGCGVSGFQITLDGDEIFHNKTRILRSKKGTFSRILGNLIQIRNNPTEFNILVRIHYTPDNFECLKDLLSLLDREFGGDSRFNVFFKSISHLGAESDRDHIVFNNDEAKRLKKTLDEYLVNSTSLNPIYESKNSPYICYASALNAYVIRANGLIAKCTVDMYSQDGVVGVLTPGGELKVNVENIRKWASWVENFDRKALSCPRAYLFGS